MLTITKNDSVYTLRTYVGGIEQTDQVSLDDTRYSTVDRAYKLRETIQASEEGRIRQEVLDTKKALQEVQEKLAQANNHLATLLTGDPGSEATKEMIEQYPEWREGLSVDAGDAYRIGDVLYMATQPHVTSKENGPEGAQAKEYWKGGAIKQDQPDPKPGVKYPKGSVVTYQGVDYYACEDTNDGPEVGYPTWDLASNKPTA